VIPEQQENAVGPATIEFWFEFGSNYSYLSVMRIEQLTAGLRRTWHAFRSRASPILLRLRIPPDVFGFRCLHDVGDVDNRIRLKDRSAAAWKLERDTSDCAARTSSLPAQLLDAHHAEITVVAAEFEPELDGCRTHGVLLLLRDHQGTSFRYARAKNSR